MKILSDNGTEFKNQLFTDMATQLGVKCKVYSPPYHPQSMEELKDSIISLKHALLNVYQSPLNGTKWCYWLALHITFYQMSTQRKEPSSVCLVETLLFH